MSLEVIDWTLVERVTPAFAAVGTLAWWLSGRFRKVEDTARSVEKAAILLIDAHENRDQVRHEENLRRFERISVALAKLGSDNGSYAPYKESH